MNFCSFLDFFEIEKWLDRTSFLARKKLGNFERKIFRDFKQVRRQFRPFQKNCAFSVPFFSYANCTSRKLVGVCRVPFIVFLDTLHTHKVSVAFTFDLMLITLPRNLFVCADYLSLSTRTPPLIVNFFRQKNPKMSKNSLGNP